MPTAAQLKSAKKKLRKTKKPKSPRTLPNRNTYRLIKADPRVQRAEEVKRLIAEMELRKRQYMNALNKLKRM
jgi:hypothetical protein